MTPEMQEGYIPEFERDDWVCLEHNLLIPEGQACPKCMEIAGDLLTDCLDDVGHSFGIPKKMMDESTGPNYGSIPKQE